MLWGGELILRDGEPAGAVQSAAYGHSLGRSVALGLLEHPDGVDAGFLGSGAFEIDLAGVRHRAEVHLKPAYDPKGEKSGRGRRPTGRPEALSARVPTAICR